MKIKVSVTIDVEPSSFAEAYGEVYGKCRSHDAVIREDANSIAEWSLHEWIKRIGFEGRVVNPRHVS
jgi:hypothetical protein